jgi:hypothetical protein
MNNDIFHLMHKCQYPQNKLPNDALRTLFRYFRKSTKISNAKFVKCYLELFQEGEATKIPRKIMSVVFASGA